jgi:predicted RNase H-like nuclease
VKVPTLTLGPSTKEGGSRLFVGVDGCKAGWLCFTIDLDARDTGFDYADDFPKVLAKYKCARIIAVDIPIGLAERSARACDIQARRVLGKPRSSSVFPAPFRATLLATTYATACQKNLAAGGKKVNRQTFALLPKIRDVDQVMSPGVQNWVYENHPELCFWKLNGCRAMQFSKRSEDGKREHLKLLSQPFPEISGHLGQLNTQRAEPHDLLDAAAAAWTAVRIAREEAAQIPDERELDPTGLRMEMSY